MNETNQTWFNKKTALILVAAAIGIALLIYWNKKTKE